MDNSSEKDALRKVLLEKRDTTSFDLQKIAAKQIQKNLKKIESFCNAEKIGAYYPIGSEVLTQDIMQEILSQGKELFLPKVAGEDLEFRQISDFSSLEKGSFDILEPKDTCPTNNDLDVLLVPTVGVSVEGVRLGYGQGFYDRFLSVKKIETISLVLQKLVVKHIPKSETDKVVDWIVTEEKVSKIS